MLLYLLSLNAYAIIFIFLKVAYFTLSRPMPLIRFSNFIQILSFFYILIILSYILLIFYYSTLLFSF